MKIDIGGSITTLRKGAGMTQEELAGQLGVSAQAVSRWETGASMPDILLLPVIADVFGITVDELYTGVRESTEQTHYGFNELPELLYGELLRLDSYAWGHADDAERLSRLAELKSRLAEGSGCLHFSIGDRGGTVLVSDEYALVHRTFGTRESLAMLEAAEGAAVLEAILDKNAVRLFRYLIENQKKIFTTAAISRRVDMSEEECQAALDKLSAANILYCTIVDGETELPVYSVSADNTKVLCIYMILRLARQVYENKWFFGYRGSYLPMQ